MRYIGGKTDLLEKIHSEIIARRAQSVIDIFAGSGAVSTYLSKNGFRVTSNDFLFFSYVLNRGLLIKTNNSDFNKYKVDYLIKELNNISISSHEVDFDKCFIWKNYSFHEDCPRMYFREDNALRIDLIRLKIEYWKNSDVITDDEYFYLLALLIYSVPSVSNIAGVYGAYLKQWDPRSFKKLELSPIEIPKDGPDSNALNLDFIDALRVSHSDLLYADPPYNSRQYLPNYHILETIARYDYPEIHGVTGMRAYDSTQKSDFCSRAKVKSAFISLIENAQVKSVVISYNSEGLLPEHELEDICRYHAKAGSFNKLTIPYRRFKSHSGIIKNVNELIFSFDK